MLHLKRIALPRVEHVPGAHVAALGLPALLWAGSVAATMVWSQSMPDMGAIPLPGGSTMSAMWAPMCGQTWAGAAASFTGMWTVMMVAMMTPSLLPLLWRYRSALAAQSAFANTQPGSLAARTALAAAGYFSVWAATGLAVFYAGAALAEAAQHMPALAHALPVATGGALVFAGMFQFTRLKAHALKCCRGGCQPRHAMSGGLPAAWRQGMAWGWKCSQSCAGFTVVLLGVGLMDLWPMVLITLALTVERLAPDGERAARMAGASCLLAAALVCAAGTQAAGV